LFVDVPEDIEANGVHAERFAHFDALFPVGTRDAGIVKLGCFDHKRLPIKQECVLADREIATAGLCRECGKA